jgi:hypothetical protein
MGDGREWERWDEGGIVGGEKKIRNVKFRERKIFLRGEGRGRNRVNEGEGVKRKNN